MIPQRADCVVVGSGPAGSTFAILVKMYAPELRVIMIDRDHHPRWHIGETTIPVANVTLQEIGVYDELIRREAVRKIGIIFVWGPDPQPWNADFLSLVERRNGLEPTAVWDIQDQDFSRIEGTDKRDEPVATAFNVDRAEFDRLLVDRAREVGVEVHEGCLVTGVDYDTEGRVGAVRWESDGRRGVVETDFFMDAGGLGSLMTGEHRGRDHKIDNLAVFGYLSGAGWKVTYRGTRERTAIVQAAVPGGWLWYFPIGPDTMSVGAVSRAEICRPRIRELGREGYFWEMLRSCPELEPLVRDATLRDDVLPNGRTTGSCKDWATWAARPSGKGWAAAGDAAVHVDPIMSAGVTMALQSARRAAYTYLQQRRSAFPGETELWEAYDTYLRGETAALRRLASYFYGNGGDRDSPFWRRQRELYADWQLDLDPEAAYGMAQAGFVPWIHAITPEIVARVVQGLDGNRVDLLTIFEGDGLPPLERIDECWIEPLTPFRLGLRTDPDGPDLEPGELGIYWDLVPCDGELAHRATAIPFHIGPGLVPVVDSLGEPEPVRDVLARAPELIVGPAQDPGRIRASTVALLAAAATKGFIELRLPAERS